MTNADHRARPGPADDRPLAATPPPTGFSVQDRRFWVAGEEAAAASAAAPAAQYPTYVEQLRADLAVAQRDAAAKDDQLQEQAAAIDERVAEGLGAVHERLARDAEKQLTRARGELATGLLEVLDNLQRSLLAAEQSRSVDALLAGLRQIEAQFVARLAALGLERIPAAGVRFDPAVHEAVGVVAAGREADDGLVTVEVQTGFRLAGAVVRPARVLVAKHSA